MNYLDLLIYVTTAAVVLAIIGIIGMLIDLCGDYVYTFLSRTMDRDNESLGQRIEELDEMEDFCGTPSANELELEMKEVWHELTQQDGSETVIQYDGETTKEIEEDFGMDFLSDKFKEGDKKVANGEISCNLDNPEDCENCGS
jgi:hypothetical protein